MSQDINCPKDQQATSADKRPVNEVIVVNESERGSPPNLSRSFCDLPFSLFKDGCTYDQIFNTSGRPMWVKYSSGGDQYLVDETQAGVTFKVTSPDQVSLATGLGNLQSGEVLFSRLKALLRRIHLFSSEQEADFLSAYGLATWTYDAHPYVGYVAISGPPGANKSGLLFGLEQLVYAGFKISGSATDAVIFRRIHATRGTLLQDEAQQEFGKSTTRLHKILTEGNAFNGFVEIAVPTKDGDYVPKKFSAYGPKIFACRDLPDDEAILSRTTELNLPALEEDPRLEKFTDEKWQADAKIWVNDALFYRQRKRLGELPTPSVGSEDIFSELKLTGRERQVYGWLIEECPSEQALRSLNSLIIAQRAKLVEDRMQLPEVGILMQCLDLSLPASFAAIAMAVSLQGIPVTAKAVGKALRRNHLEVVRRNTGPVLVATHASIRTALTRLGIPVAHQGPTKGGG